MEALSHTKTPVNTSRGTEHSVDDVTGNMNVEGNNFTSEDHKTIDNLQLHQECCQIIKQKKTSNGIFLLNRKTICLLIIHYFPVRFKFGEILFLCFFWYE